MDCRQLCGQEGSGFATIAFRGLAIKALAQSLEFGDVARKLDDAQDNIYG